MSERRDNGLLSFTINLQGGSPHGYSDGEQLPWINSAFDALGDLRSDYMARLRLILDRADELGMSPILGLFYWGQNQRLADENAVLRACDRTTDWILDNGYRHVLIEINNQADISDLGVPHLHYHHNVLGPARVHELIQRVQERCEARQRVRSSVCLPVLALVACLRRGNTNAHSIMIGEKCAVMVRDDARAA